MNENLILRRIISAIIDSLIMFFLLFMVGFCYLHMFNLSEVDYQAAPFLLILSLLMPFKIMFELIIETGGFCITDPFCGLIPILVIFEWLFLCLSEVILSGRTVGKLILGLQAVRNDGSPLKLMNIILRNIGKVFSRYVFYLPMIMCFFSKKQRTLHDLVGNSCVKYS